MNILDIISEMYENKEFNKELLFDGNFLDEKDTIDEQYNKLICENKPPLEAIKRKHIEMLKNEKMILLASIGNKIINEQVDLSAVEQYILDQSRTESELSLVDENFIRTELSK